MKINEIPIEIERVHKQTSVLDVIFLTFIAFAFLWGAYETVFG